MKSKEYLCSIDRNIEVKDLVKYDYDHIITSVVMDSRLLRLDDIDGIKSALKGTDSSSLDKYFDISKSL
jgi:hypothetical protein